MNTRRWDLNSLHRNEYGRQRCVRSGRAPVGWLQVDGAHGLRHRLCLRSLRTSCGARA